MAVQIKSSLTAPPLVLPIFLCCKLETRINSGLLVYDEFGYTEYNTTSMTPNSVATRDASTRIYGDNIYSYPLVYRSTVALSKTYIDDAHDRSVSRNYGDYKTVLTDTNGCLDSSYVFWLGFYAWVIPNKKYRFEGIAYGGSVYGLTDDSIAGEYQHELVIDENDDTYMLTGVDYYQYAGSVLQYLATIQVYYT